MAIFYSNICSDLIIEFVPKEDSQVGKLLATREDIFGNYNKENFEKEFLKYFTIQNATKVKTSERTLYHMRKK